MLEEFGGFELELRGDVEMKVERGAPASPPRGSPEGVTVLSIFLSGPTPHTAFGKVHVPLPTPASLSLQGKGKVRTYWLLGERGTSTRG